MTEDALEEAEWILHIPAPNGQSIYVEDMPDWQQYINAATAGYILDTEYRRFLKAKDFADRFLEHSYIYEFQNHATKEYKVMRYEYALSPGNAPAWFHPDKAVLWVEEIVTAYCFLVFSVLDFAEENSYRAA